MSDSRNRMFSNARKAVVSCWLALVFHTVGGRLAWHLMVVGQGVGGWRQRDAGSILKRSCHSIGRESPPRDVTHNTRPFPDRREGGGYAKLSPNVSRENAYNWFFGRQSTTFPSEMSILFPYRWLVKSFWTASSSSRVMLPCRVVQNTRWREGMLRLLPILFFLSLSLFSNPPPPIGVQILWRKSTLTDTFSFTQNYRVKMGTPTIVDDSTLSPVLSVVVLWKVTERNNTPEEFFRFWLEGEGCNI